MANLITIARMVLLFVTIWMMYVGNVQVITACIFLLVIVFVSDGLDGYVARRQKTTSDFGAVFDIASDRVVENALWIVFAHMQLIPVWIPLLVMTRGFLIDGLRSMGLSAGKTPFGKNNMMRSAFTEWLTAGRFMRAFYGYAKSLAFVFLCGLEAWKHHDTANTVLGSIYDVDLVRYVGWATVYVTVALTVIRGLPVVYDFMAQQKEENASRARPSENG
jgi:CDP-diacylglycerol--glycerol-3-phosphate 3-phosphatidyltransferase